MGCLSAKHGKAGMPAQRQKKAVRLIWTIAPATRGEMINFWLLHFLQLGPFLFPVNRAACGYIGGSPTVCQFVFLDQFLHFLLCLFLCVYIFFILVHHPGSKIKRSDSSSSISSQSPIGWLLSFVPLTTPQPVENGFASWTVAPLCSVVSAAFMNALK